MDPIKNELILCTHSHNDTIDFRTFGDTIINECQIDYQYFKSLNYSSIFYQMYLKKNDGSFEEIPVEVDNYEVTPTLLNYQAPETQKKFFKRFFLIFNRCEQESQLVFAKNVTLKIELDRQNKDGVSKANKVYLKIYYMLEDESNSKNINVSFVSDYYMNEEKIRYNVYGFLILFFFVYLWLLL